VRLEFVNGFRGKDAMRSIGTCAAMTVLHIIFGMVGQVDVRQSK
jgi:hypothetical protein